MRAFVLDAVKLVAPPIGHLEKNSDDDFVCSLHLPLFGRLSGSPVDTRILRSLFSVELSMTMRTTAIHFLAAFQIDRVAHLRPREAHVHERERPAPLGPLLHRAQSGEAPQGPHVEISFSFM